MYFLVPDTSKHHNVVLAPVTTTTTIDVDVQSSILSQLIYGSKLSEHLWGGTSLKMA